VEAEVAITCSTSGAGQRIGVLMVNSFTGIESGKNVFHVSQDGPFLNAFI